MRFKSNKMLAITAVAGLLLPVLAAPGVHAARSAATSKSSVSLIWFMRTDPNETPWEKAEVAGFEKLNPNIKINLITAPNANGQFDLKFNQLIASGTPADIWSHLGQAGFADYYHRGLLLNLRPLIKSSGYSFGSTPMNLVNTYAKPDGGIYGIPSITLGSYLFYNKDIFDAYNKLHPTAKLAYPTVNWDDKTWTYAKLLDDAKKLNGMSITTSSGKANVYGYYDGRWPPMATAFQAGTDMFPPGSYNSGLPKTVNLTDPRIVAVYQQNANNYLKSHISPTYSKVKQITNTGAEPFQFGDVAMEDTGGWGFRSFRTVKFHWAAAALPWRTTNTDVLFTDPYMVAKTCKNPAAAMTFIKYLTNDASMTSYIKSVGFTPADPAHLTFWYNEESKITGMSVPDLVKLVAGARKYGVESPNHLIANFSQIVNTMQTYIDKIYYGQGAVGPTLASAQSAIDAILAQSSGG